MRVPKGSRWENRLVEVKDGVNVVLKCEYDGLSRRIRKYTDKSGDDWTVREYYHNSGWQALEVRKEVKSRAAGEPQLGQDNRVGQHQRRAFPQFLPLGVIEKAHAAGII